MLKNLSQIGLKHEKDVWELGNIYILSAWYDIHQYIVNPDVS